MLCPICQTDNNKIVNTKSRDRDRSRIYNCLNCGGKFKTAETIVGVKFVGTKGRYLAICNAVKNLNKVEKVEEENK